MRLAPRDTLLSRNIASLLVQGRSGVAFLGRGGDILAEVGPNDYNQYVATRKAQIQSGELKAIAYLGLVKDQMARAALIENHEGPDSFLSVVVVGPGDPKGYWFAPEPDAMDIVERQLGKEAAEEET